MPSPIEQAIQQIADEKGLSYEAIMEAIESALAAAYRKDFGNKMQNLVAEFDTETAQARVFDVKTVVEDMEIEEEPIVEEEETGKKAKEEAPTVESSVAEGEDEQKFNPKTEVMITKARETHSNAQIGDVLRTELSVPGEFGRMAAQTAKQVITQKLREAEREIIYNEFKDNEGEVIAGTVQRKEGRVVLVDIGRTTGVLRQEDQVSRERYNPGSRMKFYVREVGLTTRGPEILLSRIANEIVSKLFETEIPEVAEGDVEIKGIARDPGFRSKVAVFAKDENIDPIGACIGQRGSRIQTIITELGGEKVDIVEWSKDSKEFIAHALSPAKVESVELDEESKSAVVTVAPDQLSLAIGRGGQNVRLAAHLTGWKLNIAESGKGIVNVEGEDAIETTEPEQPTAESEEKPAENLVEESAPAQE
ncbi:MAG: hypothetical protein ACD_76C00114G0003 [uncultured bacterium]|nr:MAG: hypothetical protein ACD_76C00114G0003 [uncultured bacterium]HBD05343.1 transcription termination/antitermination protein NusA [Candidatus Uhrbacteria bacterium]